MILPVHERLRAHLARVLTTLFSLEADAVPSKLVGAPIRIQELLLAADHVHPVAAVTDTWPLPPEAETLALAGVTAYEQAAAEKMKVFDAALSVLPPGPTAATRDSYRMPLVGIDERPLKWNRMRPSPSGAGLPSGSV